MAVTKKQLEEQLKALQQDNARIKKQTEHWKNQYYDLQAKIKQKVYVLQDEEEATEESQENEPLPDPDKSEAKYQSLINQLEYERILYKSAMESIKRYEDQVKSREADIEDLKKQNELLVKQYKEMQALPMFAGNTENPLPDPTVDELKAKIERLTAEKENAEKRADRIKNCENAYQELCEETMEKNRKLSESHDELKIELEETRKELQQAQDEKKQDLELQAKDNEALNKLRKERDDMIKAYKELQSKLGRPQKLTEEQETLLYQLRAEGLSMAKIAQKLDCSPALVHKIIHKVL